MVLLGLAAALLQPASTPPDAGVVPPVEPAQANGPAFTHVPSGGEITLAYPIAAFHARRNGRVAMECIAAKDGTFKTCRITAEDPKRFNFGWAALAVAFKFRVAATMQDGTPSEGRPVHVTINFRYDNRAY